MTGPDTLVSPIGGRYSFHSQYLQINLPSQVLARLQGSEDFTDIEDAQLYARFTHEREHFAQNVCTTYGIWKTLVLRLSGFNFLHGVIELAKSNLDLVIPIDEMILRGGEDRAAGLRPFHIGKGIRTPIGYMERDSAVDSYSLFNGVSRPTTTTTPFVGWNGIPKSVNAVTLMEFQSSVRELVFIQRSKTIPDDVREKLIDEIDGRADFRLITDMGRRAFNLKDTLVSLDLLLLIYELVTLALCPDLPGEDTWAFLIPCKSPPPAKEMKSWESLHPGWRFVEITRAIKKHELPKMEWKKAPALITMICSLLGWRPPIVATLALLTSLKGIEKDAMQPFVDAAGSLAKVSDEKGYLSFDYHLLSGIGPWSGPMLRGPLPRFDERDKTPLFLNTLFGDIASQLYYSRSIFCPLCISSVHDKRCWIPEFLATIRRA